MIVYKTTNLVNGKIYVGKDCRNKSTYLGSGKWLNRAINKYGRENFKKEILEKCTPNNICDREIYWIKELKARDHKIGYNLTDGGDGLLGLHHKKSTLKKISLANSGVIPSKETRLKISKALKGKNTWSKGRKASYYTRKKQSKVSKGRPKSVEMRRKLSIAKTGVPMSEYARKRMSENHANVCGKNNPFYGRHISKKHKKIVSICLKRWWRKLKRGEVSFSLNRIKNMSDGAKRGWIKRRLKYAK